MIARLLTFLILTLAIWFAAGSEGIAVARDPGEDKPPIKSELYREYLIKAALLYNIAKFTRWPDQAFESPETPLRVCVIGEDPFGPALETIDGKLVKQRAVVTARPEAISDAKTCHVIFVSASERWRLEEILDAVGESPALTVADMPDFAAVGGIINLKVVENLSRFDINVKAATKARLSLSSKLLVLADQVITE